MEHTSKSKVFFGVIAILVITLFVVLEWREGNTEPSARDKQTPTLATERQKSKEPSTSNKNRAPVISNESRELSISKKWLSPSELLRSKETFFATEGRVGNGSMASDRLNIFRFWVATLVGKDDDLAIQAFRVITAAMLAGLKEGEPALPPFPDYIREDIAEVACWRNQTEDFLIGYGEWASKPGTWAYANSRRLYANMPEASVAVKALIERDQFRMPVQDTLTVLNRLTFGVYEDKPADWWRTSFAQSDFWKLTHANEFAEAKSFTKQ